MAILVLLIPLLTGGLFWVTSNRKIINIINISGSVLLAGAAGINLKAVIDNGVVSETYFNNVIYIDSLSAIVLMITVFVGMLVSLYSVSYMNREFASKTIGIKRLKIYYSLLHAFTLTMVMTVITQNMGLLWIAVEATTLASAFLVGFYNNKKSIEAAWKYIIICSVGIAFALLGIILLYYSSVKSFGQTAFGLNWSFLYENAGELQGSILKMSFIFILIGFGTKVGFAPMHTWLPDAHSQAPSPISALLSGVLLNTAMYGIIRVMAITNKNLGNGVFTGRIMMVFGVLSIGTAAVFILVQGDFKRILGYSSIEHMGIIALGFGLLTPISVFCSLYHMFNHAMTKSMLFLASGNIYLKYHTKNISKIQGVMRIMPFTGAIFAIGIFAIAGMPPFSIFTSELGIILSAFGKGRYLTAALVLIFLLLVFAGFVTRMLRMFFGEPEGEIIKGEFGAINLAAIIVLLAVICITGLYLPPNIRSLMESAARIITGQ